MTVRRCLIDWKDIHRLYNAFWNSLDKIPFLPFAIPYIISFIHDIFAYLYPWKFSRYITNDNRLCYLQW